MPDLYDFSMKAVVARFDPSTSPTAPELRAVIRGALGA